MPLGTAVRESLDQLPDGLLLRMLAIQWATVLSLVVIAAVAVVT